MKGNTLLTNHYLTRNYHMEFSFGGKDPDHYSPVCSHGHESRSRANSSELFPPCRPLGQKAKRGLLGAIRGSLFVKYSMKYYFY